MSVPTSTNVISSLSSDRQWVPDSLQSFFP